MRKITVTRQSLEASGPQGHFQTIYGLDEVLTNFQVCIVIVFRLVRARDTDTETKYTSENTNNPYHLLVSAGFR